MTQKERNIRIELWLWRILANGYKNIFRLKGTVSVHHCELLGLSAGCFSRGEMENSNP